MTIEDEMENGAVEPVELAEGVGGKVSTRWKDGSLEEVLKAAQGGDEEAIEEVVQRFEPLVNKIAWQYQWSGAPLEDLKLAGVLGVLKAIKRFKPCRGDFQAYVRHWIRWEVQKCVFEHLGVTSSSFRKALLKIVRAQEELAKDLGRVPTEMEIAQRTNLTEKEVQTILRWMESLERIPPPEEGIPPPSPQDLIEECVPDPRAREGSQELLKRDARKVLWRVTGENPVYRVLLEEHILGGKTMEELAPGLGISAAALRQRKRHFLNSLREMLTREEWSLEEFREALEDC